MTNTHLPQWSSRLGFILATTGAAVGLGNLWRFPYIAGMHGGGTFVLLYCVCVVLIGIPIMFAEMLIGKSTRKNPVDAIHTLATESNSKVPWHWMGYWGAFGLILVLSFYSVVAGWAFYFFQWALTHDFSSLTPSDVQSSWQAFTQSPSEMIGWHTFFLASNGLIAIAGVQSGLERSTRIMMPTLYLTLITLVLLAWQHDGLEDAASFLFHFDWQQVTIHTWLTALGHAFFTLAIGAGALLTYGAYAPDNTSLIKSAMIVAILDILVAILAGLAIFPWVFGHGLPASEGPGLMFEALPISLLAVSGGQWIAAGFFLLLALAALTSSINIAEPLIVLLNEKANVSRRAATSIVLCIAWVLGLASIFSFNEWQTVTVFKQNIFELITNSVTEVILPVGGLIIAVFSGWIITNKRRQEGFLPNEKNLQAYCLFCLKYMAPVAMIAILVTPLL